MNTDVQNQNYEEIFLAVFEKDPGVEYTSDFYDEFEPKECRRAESFAQLMAERYADHWLLKADSMAMIAIVAHVLLHGSEKQKIRARNILLERRRILLQFSMQAELKLATNLNDWIDDGLRFSVCLQEQDFLTERFLFLCTPSAWRCEKLVCKLNSLVATKLLAEHLVKQSDFDFGLLLHVIEERSVHDSAKSKLFLDIIVKAAVQQFEPSHLWPIFSLSGESDLAVYAWESIKLKVVENRDIETILDVVRYDTKASIQQDAWNTFVALRPTSQELHRFEEDDFFEEQLVRYAQHLEGELAAA